MRLHISYKIYSTSWSYWSIRVLTVIIFPVPALPTEVYLRFELGWHLGYAGGTRESTGPEFPHHHRPLQKCKNTNTTVGLVGKKKELLLRCYLISRTNFKVPPTVWNYLLFNFVMPLHYFHMKKKKAKVSTVPFLDFLLPVILKGMISSVSPISKMLLFSMFLVLLLKPQFFLEKICSSSAWKQIFMWSKD